MEQPYASPTGMSPIGPGGPPPKNWLVESILVTIFCCLPFGIVAIINASNVNSRLALGDYAGAQEASLNAGKWVKYGLIGAVLQVVIPIFLVFVLGMGGALLGAFTDQ
jgi:Interferon-induced transmembrane protein